MVVCMLMKQIFRITDSAVIQQGFSCRMLSNKFYYLMQYE